MKAHRKQIYTAFSVRFHRRNTPTLLSLPGSLDFFMATESRSQRRASPAKPFLPFPLFLRDNFSKATEPRSQGSLHRRILIFYRQIVQKIRQKAIKAPFFVNSYTFFTCKIRQNPYLYGGFCPCAPLSALADYCTAHIRAGWCAPKG